MCPTVLRERDFRSLVSRRHEIRKIKGRVLRSTQHPFKSWPNGLANFGRSICVSFGHPLASTSVDLC